MLLIDELLAEHRLIERVSEAFLAYAAGPAGDARAGDTAAFLRFFRGYANRFHHAREEDTLFAALRERGGLPADRGPLAVLVADHRRMEALLGEIEALPAGAAGAPHPAGFRTLAASYVHALWHHIDAEDSVLFPECEPRLRRNGVAELPSRPMDADERAAKAEGESLVLKYPPAGPRDGDPMRGDGCIMCPAYGVTCRGLELEWWNEWEWDEFEDRMGGD